MEATMKKYILMAALGALSTLASAQTQQTEVRISGALARIELPEQLRNMWPDEFDQVKGTYYLSDGKTMQLSMWGNRMYAKIDGMPRTQLVAASPYSFVGLDRQMKLRITNAEGTGPLKAEVLLLLPDLADSSAPATLTRLVASR
jgi:hypothetical protein